MGIKLSTVKYIMKRFNNRVKISILIYLLVTCIVYKIKPPIMFEKNKLKEFGVGSTQTLLSFPVFSMMSAIGIYYIFTMLCINYSKC
jgi:hypothetical protein